MEGFAQFIAGGFGILSLVLWIVEPESKWSGWAGSITLLGLLIFNFSVLSIYDRLPFGFALGSGSLFGWIVCLFVAAAEEKLGGQHDNKN